MLTATGRPAVTVVSIVLMMVLGACATVPEDAGFDDVREAVAERAGLDVVWDRDSPEDASVDEAVGVMLASPLRADVAVQIALLNNRRLQATYERLGVAQGELVQAGLLRNPLFHAGVGFTEEGLDLDFSVVQSFLEVFTIPLRRRVARERFKEARLEVTGEVLDMAWQVRRAFVEQQARLQTYELEKIGFAASEAAMTLAVELHRAGNISPLVLTSERAQHEQARLDLARAELALREGHERLSALMGLWGERADWRLDVGLAPMPADALDTADFEQKVVAASLDLSLSRQRIAVVLSEMGLTDVESLLPDFELGAEAVREDGEWEVGPTAALALPLFDHGQGRDRIAEARVRQLWHEYTATAVELRAEARVAAMRLGAARARSEHATSVVLPLRRQVLAQTQQFYNGMFIGGFELIAARVGVVEAERQAIGALRDYWLASSDAALLLQGRMTPMGAGGQSESVEAGAGAGAKRGGGH